MYNIIASNTSQWHPSEEAMLLLRPFNCSWETSAFCSVFTDQSLWFSFSSLWSMFTSIVPPLEQESDKSGQRWRFILPSHPQLMRYPSCCQASPRTKSEWELSLNLEKQNYISTFPPRKWRMHIVNNDRVMDVGITILYRHIYLSFLSNVALQIGEQKFKLHATMFFNNKFQLQSMSTFHFKWGPFS